MLASLKTNWTSSKWFFKILLPIVWYYKDEDEDEDEDKDKDKDTYKDKDTEKVPETPNLCYIFEILMTHSFQIWW